MVLRDVYEITVRHRGSDVQNSKLAEFGASHRLRTLLGPWACQRCLCVSVSQPAKSRTILRVFAYPETFSARLFAQQGRDLLAQFAELLLLRLAERAQLLGVSVHPDGQAAAIFLRQPHLVMARRGHYQAI